MELIVVTGDLLDQKVEAIINPWNRNLIPWWLLIPKGVSGAIKRRAGFGPFIELRRAGTLALGASVVTSAGRLPFKAIIHVAGIGHNWCSSEKSIRSSVKSALDDARSRGFASVALPLIGAGTGGGSEESVQKLIEDECRHSNYGGKIVIVRYKPLPWASGDCYCSLWESAPDTLEKKGIPKGYCGLCDVCGAPGHLRHFPGSAPFTGGWCKKHYYRAMFLHPMGTIGTLVWVAGILAIIIFVKRLLG
nr:macro domain-containing protein [Geoanaerobacter pelophilus]